LFRVRIRIQLPVVSYRRTALARAPAAPSPWTRRSCAGAACTRREPGISGSAEGNGADARLAFQLRKLHRIPGLVWRDRLLAHALFEHVVRHGTWHRAAQRLRRRFRDLSLPE